MFLALTIYDEQKKFFYFFLPFLFFQFFCLYIYLNALYIRSKTELSFVKKAKKKKNTK
jgi:hypothetical protein